MLQFVRVRPDNPSVHECFYVDIQGKIDEINLGAMLRLFSDPGYVVSPFDPFEDLPVRYVEIGPHLSVETAFSSNAVNIFNSIGIPVRRVEMSRRFMIGEQSMDSEGERAEIIRTHLDQMTQQVYERPLDHFADPREPESVRRIPIIGFAKANAELGLGMDSWDVAYYSDLFAELKRDATDVELFQAGNGNSEHSRHWFFRGNQEINGHLMPLSLMSLVRRPLEMRRAARRAGESDGSITAFHDNAGVIRGQRATIILPKFPGRMSLMRRGTYQLHITMTAETHNHPTMVAPFPGAETGGGGRIRDSLAVGRGALQHVGGAGYAVGNLGAKIGIPGEYRPEFASKTHATPLSILIEGSNGVSDYGNKIGEPLIGGFCRSFGQMVDGAMREYRKPILYSAGMGRMLDMHVEKGEPKKGMLIVAIGGPAYRIGVGGGSASSMTHGAQSAELDRKSVQRGDAEMENRVNRVIKTCCELLSKNPIVSIHDQGAGGPSNVLTELMDPIGGKVDIRKISVGDKTMSVLEIWVAEYQERYGLLAKPGGIGTLKAICARERVNCEVVGEITGDGRIVLEDSSDGSTPVDLPLSKILGDLPKKTFKSERKRKELTPVTLPAGLSIIDAARAVFRQLSVGSKKFLTNKVDRSVTGLVARQQCCGPTQIPVSDVAVTADGFFGITGAAKAYGEQPIKMLIDAKAGARMAVAEVFTNLCAAHVRDLRSIDLRANWMWPAKKPHEGAEIYDACEALSDALCELRAAINGGKDSLSMATNENGDESLSPGTLVLMAVAPVPDIRKIATPDFKGGRSIGYVHLGREEGPYRLGGSALAQAYGQLGDESPDVMSMRQLAGAFRAMQECIRDGLVSAYHDVSDGGLFTTLAEMCLAGHHGCEVELGKGADPIPELFAEEPGMVFEYQRANVRAIRRRFHKHGVRFRTIGHTDSGERQFSIAKGGARIYSDSLELLRLTWEQTSSRLELLQSSERTAQAESASHALDEPFARQCLTFKPVIRRYGKENRPRVAILREEGVNGDREMTAAFMHAGFDAFDVNMEDLKGQDERVFDSFRGLVFPGGFSYGDVLGSAKGWAAPVLFNPSIKAMFDRFYDRTDTFSLGVCNGFQFMTQIGVLPRRGISIDAQPRLVHNDSKRFESRWVTVEIRNSPSWLLKGMAGSRLGIWVAHGEGKLIFPDQSLKWQVLADKLVPMSFVGPGEGAPDYPFNPNGSEHGWTALVSDCGRHLGMMPHAERSFLPWQWPWMPPEFRKHAAAPWLKMFQNAREFCAH